FFFSSRRRHTRSKRDWSSDVCSSDLQLAVCHFVFRLDGYFGSLGDLSDTLQQGQLGAWQRFDQSCLISVFGPGEASPAQRREYEIGRASCRGGGENWMPGVRRTDTKH